MSPSCWSLIGLLLLGCITASPGQTLAAEATANPTPILRPEILQEGTACRIVMPTRPGLWDNNIIWWYYEGTVLKAGKDGVLLAAARHSGFSTKQIPRIALWIPFQYSWPLYLPTPGNVGCAREELGGKEVWIPAAKIHAIERMTIIEDE